MIGLRLARLVMETCINYYTQTECDCPCRLERLRQKYICFFISARSEDMTGWQCYNKLFVLVQGSVEDADARRASFCQGNDCTV